MFRAAFSINPDAAAAYAGYERQVTIRHLRVGCLLAMVLMPAGMILDWAVYPDRAQQFAVIRFACSALEGALLLALQTDLAKRFNNAFSLTIAMLPVLSICTMIAVTEGAGSPYYAGLNLVTLSIAFVLRWTVGLSVVATLLVIVFYVASCAWHSPLQWRDGMLVNNLYFLTVTGLIVVVGGRIHQALRISEFALRFELDQKKSQLEISNEQLNQKKGELELSNTQLTRTKAELEVSNRELSSQKQQLEETLEKLRLTQDELVTKEKQASLGVWSAGIIHEINNPLNYVRTGLYALRNLDQHLPESERGEFKEVFQDIDDGVKRVHDIVSDLRSYAHPGSDVPALVALEDVVRMALRFCAEELRGRIEVVQNVPPGFAVYAERNKLIQVLTNLVQNSIHALAEKKFTTGHPVITIEGREEAGRRLVVVRDNGPGISKENLEKVFDPFFTTKAPGQGMGLGLGICYRIIQGFGGTIRVKSEPGEFCEFTLDLPASAPDEKEA